jgi:hypothetical protein
MKNDCGLNFIYINKKENIKIIESDKMLFYEKLSFYFKEKKNLFDKEEEFSFTFLILPK